MVILTDDEVRAGLTASIAVSAARDCLIKAERGVLSGPPRMSADVGPVTLVFTVGGFVDGAIGFRAYGTWESPSEQAVMVWDADGRIAGCIVGDELGARRTGALGAVAIDALSRPAARAVGVIGSGRQAWTQLWATVDVRNIEDVRVFSPHVRHRNRFADRATAELGVATRPVSNAREAVRGADIVILATRSERPVIDADWIDAGTHVNTVGPKTLSAHETPSELAEKAAIVASDSPVQAAAYEGSFFTSRELVPLGAILTGRRPGRRSSGDISVYCSTGLSGSEVGLALALLNHARDHQTGAP